MTQVIVNGLVLSANYALIALGITLIFSIMRILNFAHGQMYMIGGFVVYYLYGVFGWNYFIALIAAALILAVIGAAFEKFLFRRVLAKSTREENSMLLAVGSALLLESLALLVFGEKQRGVPPIAEGVIFIFDAYLPVARLIVFLFSLVFIAALLSFVRFTKPGRALRAIAQNKEVTYLMGVNVDRMSSVGFAIGAGLAGVAGALLVTFLAVNSGVGTPLSIKAFIMIMIGGAGVVSGAILGAVVLGFAEAIGYSIFAGPEVYLFIFIGVIIFLIIRPQGIMGKPWG
ncbi:MAG: branched-chain amino acid ABC transporter permease [Gammaproteobacteria bacterium]|nr:branched-chain amino acid ABC transporter permease [Gammaproteobacteria bacterium]